MNTQLKPIAERSVASLHQAAMECYDHATEIDLAGDRAAALGEYRNALQYEVEAARRLALRFDFEPTRSVIHRSAAAIALRCEDYREAERLIAVALSGNPHQEVAEELRDLLEQVYRERHPGPRTVELAENEIQITITGKANGDGVHWSEHLVGRVQATERMIIRTIERSLGRPFREATGGMHELSGYYQLALSVPQGGDFAFTLRLDLPKSPYDLEGEPNSPLLNAQATIQNILECFRSYNTGDEVRLEQLIPDPAYRRNFLGLARQIAPDGDQVKMVGMTANPDRPDHEVTIHRPRREDGRGRVGSNPKGVVTVTGGLLFASSTTKTNTIKVVDDQDVRHTFQVPEGMMADIVKPLWANRVRVVGFKKGNRKVELESIDPVRKVVDDPR